MRFRKVMKDSSVICMNIMMPVQRLWKEARVLSLLVSPLKLYYAIADILLIAEFVLSDNVASWNEITPRIKIDRPLEVYRFLEKLWNDTFTITQMSKFFNTFMPKI